jgi:hypothetical protein
MKAAILKLFSLGITPRSYNFFETEVNGSPFSISNSIGSFSE